MWHNVRVLCDVCRRQYANAKGLRETYRKKGKQLILNVSQIISIYIVQLLHLKYTPYRNTFTCCIEFDMGRRLAYVLRCRNVPIIRCCRCTNISSETFMKEKLLCRAPRRMEKGKIIISHSFSRTTVAEPNCTTCSRCV